MTQHKPWFVYLLECADRSVYTGIALDVQARFAQHSAGRGARYTRSHAPQRLLLQFACPDRACALRLEYRIKQLSAQRKRDLAALLASRES